MLQVVRTVWVLANAGFWLESATQTQVSFRSPFPFCGDFRSKSQGMLGRIAHHCRASALAPASTAVEAGRSRGVTFLRGGARRHGRRIIQADQINTRDGSRSGRGGPYSYPGSSRVLHAAEEIRVSLQTASPV